jgi:hypothetical protein
VTIANGVPAQFTVTVSTSGSALLPPTIPERFAPPAGIRLLFLLAFALVLVIASKKRWMFDGALRGRHLAWSGALTAIFLCSVIYAAGCGSTGSAPPTTLTPPPLVTPSGNSTIIVTPVAMSSAGQPLQLQPIQLTLTVK